MDWGLKVMTFVALAVIVAMAIFYIVSAGNEGMMTTAKSGIKAAFVGFAVMLSAWLIISTTLRIFSATIPGLGITSSGFSFSCDTTSSAGTAPSTGAPGVGAPTAGGAVCTDPVAFKASLASGGKACSGVCSRTKCNFTSEVLSAIENNSGTMDKKLVKSFVCRESSGDKGAINNAGTITSCGLMQVNWNEVPGNTNCSGPAKNLMDANVNIQEGVRVFQAKIAMSNPGSYSAAGITAVQMAAAAYNCCGNGDRPNDPSASCGTGAGTDVSQGWPALPKWACPINPGTPPFNMCHVKGYACDVESCVSQY